jgi:UDP-glucose 4-epimerase
VSTVVVTRPAEFIGGYVVEELLQRECHVMRLDHESKYGPITKTYDAHPNYSLVPVVSC